MQLHFEGAVTEETARAVAFYPSPGHSDGLQLLWLCKCQIGKWNIHDVMTRQTVYDEFSTFKLTHVEYWQHSPALQPRRLHRPSQHYISMSWQGQIPFHAPQSSHSSPSKTQARLRYIFILHVKLELHHLPCPAAYIVP
jgi:hypothetical protein